MAPLRGVRDRVECMRIRPLLQSFLDGQLGGAERQQVVAHLEACRRCGLSAATYRTLKDELGKLNPGTDVEAVARLQAFVDQLDAQEHRREGPVDGDAHGP